MVPDDDPFALERTRNRLAMLEAMATAIERRQEFMDVIASAGDADAARQEIMTHFAFSDTQAVAVLDLQVRRFADGELRRINEEADGIRRQLNQS
jgi:DNA gyrase subunit A